MQDTACDKHPLIVSSSECRSQVTFNVPLTGEAVCIFTSPILHMRVLLKRVADRKGSASLNCPTSPAGHCHIPSVPASRQSLGQD